MRSLSALDLLDVWEHGQGSSPLERAISLLVSCSPEISWDTFARMPIGERDGQLLTLREQVFGQDMAAIARCPSCGELVETTLRSSEIRIPGIVDLLSVPPLQFEDYTVRFRLPDSRDLMAIADVTDARQARNLLLERCIEGTTRGQDAFPSAELPGPVLDAVFQGMEAADPQANTSLALTCPSCEMQWQENLDILDFFWNEIEDWAGRTLEEVHLLALAYGWSEPEILSMSAARRQIYLEKVTE